MNVLSERLKELRGPSSQKEMAEAIGIKWNAWARYERGEVSPGAEILANICRVHACSADWLLGLKDSCSGSQNNSVVKTSPGGVTIGCGVGNRVTGVVVGESAACAKCPYKKKLKALEKVFGK